MRKAVLVLLAVLQFGVCQAVHCPTSLLSEASPSHPNSHWRRQLKDLDSALRKQFPEYVGYYHLGNPLTLVLMHTKMEQSKRLELTKVDHFLFEIRYLLPVDSDEPLYGRIQSFEIPKKLRQKYLQLSRTIDEKLRQSRRLAFVRELFPNIPMQVEETGPNFTIDREGMANITIRPELLPKLYALYPNIEFFPHDPARSPDE